MKKYLPFVAILIIAVVGTYGYFASREAHGPDQGITGATNTAWDIVDETKGLDLPSSDTSVNAPAEAVAADQLSESHIVSPLAPQYWPAASVNLSGGTLGNQRVPFTDEIGDIHQIYFHLPSYTLFMSVTEPDGLRSVWQMKENRKPERVFAGTSAKGDLVLFGTSDGAIYIQQDNPCSLYRSGDQFQTWHLVSKDACMFWSMADDGKGNVYGTLHNWNEAVLWHSPDNGFSWEPWIDFQKVFPQFAVTYAAGDDRFKLRHLHDVFYDELSDSIVVSTGDVTRMDLVSSNNGKTWRKFGDTGFTSHVVVGGDKYLLGPDQLHSNGINLYDAKKGTVKEVWDPKPYGYAGYVYSMVNVEGVYYAAVHTEANEVESLVPKFGIIVSPDGEKWYRFLEWGPLGNHARTDIWLAQAPGIVYAAVNGSLYAFRPLDKAWFSEHLPFGSDNGGASAAKP